jgi:hypothetical protein
VAQERWHTSLSLRPQSARHAHTTGWPLLRCLLRGPECTPAAPPSLCPQGGHVQTVPPQDARQQPRRGRRTPAATLCSRQPGVHIGETPDAHGQRRCHGRAPSGQPGSGRAASGHAVSLPTRLLAARPSDTPDAVCCGLLQRRSGGVECGGCAPDGRGRPCRWSCATHRGQPACRGQPGTGQCAWPHNSTQPGLPHLEARRHRGREGSGTGEVAHSAVSVIAESPARAHGGQASDATAAGRPGVDQHTPPPAGAWADHIQNVQKTACGAWLRGHQARQACLSPGHRQHPASPRDGAPRGTPAAHTRGTHLG